MKPLFALVLAFLLGACAETQPTAREVGAHMERGLSGQGEIVPLDHSGEPNLNPPVTQAAPSP